MKNKMFVYGIKLKAFSIMHLPSYGLIKVEDDVAGKYTNILYYAFPLNDHEQNSFEMVYLGERT